MAKKRELTALEYNEKKALVDAVWAVDEEQRLLAIRKAEMPRAEYVMAQKALQVKADAAQRAFRIFKREHPEPSDQGQPPRIDK